VMAVLEGGYDLDALGASVVATLLALTGRAASGQPAAPPPAAVPVVETPPSAIRARLRAARRHLHTHWRI